MATTLYVSIYILFLRRGWEIYGCLFYLNTIYQITTVQHDFAYKYTSDHLNLDGYGICYLKIFKYGDYLPMTL